MLRRFFSLPLTLAIGAWFLYDIRENIRDIVQLPMAYFANRNAGLELDLNKDFADYNENELRQNFSPLTLVCIDDKSSLGSRTCMAPLKSVNKIEANYIAFIFDSNGKIRLLKIEFPQQSHSAVTADLDLRYARMENIPEPSGGIASAVSVWRSKSGIIGYAPESKESEDQSVVWQSCKENRACS